MSSLTLWFQPPTTVAPAPRSSYSGDRRDDGSVYVHDDDTLIRAVNVAGATGRPLLVAGPSGCGKSSLAYHVASCMNWPVYFHPITSRTQAGDLLYTIDTLSRLQDAEGGQLDAFSKYIKPGVLWKAFDPTGAVTRSGSAKKTSGEEGNGIEAPQSGPANGAVVLLDEIDKADPDVPNNLLIPLGSYEFLVPELENATVAAQRLPFVVMTTNNERKLPQAFLRRCIQATVSMPNAKLLKAAGKAHYPALDSARIDAIAKVLTDEAGNNVSGVSIAEFLDTVHACHLLNIDPSSADWAWLQNLTATKPGYRRELA